MYAVLETGGKQYRVSAGDTLEIERVAAEAGQPFTFDRVLAREGDKLAPEVAVTHDAPLALGEGI